MPAVNIDKLAQAYFIAHQEHLTRKNTDTWDDLSSKRKESIYVIVRTAMEAIASMGLTIVPPDMVMESRYVTLTPIQTTRELDSTPQIPRRRK